MESILVTGCSGLLGSKIIKQGFREFKCFGADVVTPKNINNDYEFYSLDIADKDKTIELIEKLRPYAVIHPAALTNVDYCEEHPEDAYKINAKGTENVAMACEKVGAKLIYVSTDFVFDGEKGLYKETDPINPVSVYGQTKYKGEKLIENINIDYCIARTSVLYGWHKNFNFVTWIIGELKNNNKINIVTDQYTSPTYADNLAEVLLTMVRKDIKGTFHTAGSERIGRLEFAEKIADVFELNKKLINPITSGSLKQKAKRPVDSSLDVGKTEKEVGIHMMDIYEGLNEMKNEIEEQ